MAAGKVEKWFAELQIHHDKNFEKPLVFFGQAAVSALITTSISGYPLASSEAPGPRHPLDPVLLRHTQIRHSASLAVGIIVP